MSVNDLYRKERQNFINRCVRCGNCAEACPVLQYTDLKDDSSLLIQESVFRFLETGERSKEAYIKAFACMECFQCTAAVCPQGLDPMLMNELIKQDYIRDGRAVSLYSDNRSEAGLHRVIASLQTSSSEFARIMTATEVKKVKYVFFPGCNVYFQPDKVLIALDILNEIGEDYAFLPGLDHCCGDNQFFFGKIEEGSSQADNLVDTLLNYAPEKVILWCPTCHCRFEKYLQRAMVLPFEVMSFSQYLAQHMDLLELEEVSANRVTLHEPCKSAYTGVDLDGTRKVLQKLPGVEVIEMENHGAQTKCCGSGAAAWFPGSFRQVRDGRLAEAGETRADRLVTVCHYCHQTFAPHGSEETFQVDNYISLVAEAMGIFRPDTFKMYSQWNDLDAILTDAGDRVDHLPFTREQVIAAIQSVFMR